MWLCYNNLRARSNPSHDNTKLRTTTTHICPRQKEKKKDARMLKEVGRPMSLLVTYATMFGAGKKILAVASMNQNPPLSAPTPQDDCHWLGATKSVIICFTT
jgi:hypothetical protein